VVLLSFSMGGVMYLLMGLFDSVWLRLLIPSAAGLLFYLGGSRLFRFNEINTLLSLLKKRG
ncbi:lipopolysaccharide biosynthesis protein, partial [Parabacteroides sp. OttesenSCG-928-N08]|nr:lipopolysaccharide biosynthesis protein [Parabacteroides sp. OttesenSCG-928-N08]